ncbi:MAG: hypothetical protein BMS9Abin07_0471 [Acidimicrobiia bacterium]|nr:MAG: hypothetical protein BMS9Abin07_0471 [Acidimicrobiia bacterium]
MTAFELSKWIHLLAAAVWTGGLITLAVLVTALRSAGADRSQLRAAARAFGYLSWTALAIAAGTGFYQLSRLGWPWSRLNLKLTLVGASAALALFHQVTARRTSPALRGALQGIILVLAIAIFGAAVAAF